MEQQEQAFRAAWKACREQALWLASRGLAFTEDRSQQAAAESWQEYLATQAERARG